MKIDAQSFDQMARTVFAPVYPAIARQIVERTGITRGVCLDMGCGGGYLGLALANITELFVHFLDESAEMIELVRHNVAENGMEHRADTLRGDVAAIDLPDHCVDLVVSRGSIFFWEDCVGAFREIRRILTPGGIGYIGGGFGSARLREEIVGKMKAAKDGGVCFQEMMRRNMSPEMRLRFERALQEADIPAYSSRHTEEEGLWIVIGLPTP
jgi:ubiquinone/menaquinone biosynthesis C-methylase UbiE